MADDREPDPGDPYGRATNTERFAVLHDAAREHLDRLAAFPGVVRANGVVPSSLALACGPQGSPVRFDPPIGSAPLTITLTAFPGVLIEYGHRGRSAFPACGCDGCEEDPAKEVERFAEEVDGVLRGSFTESLTHRFGRADRYEAVLVWADDAGSTSSAGDVEGDEAPMPYGTSRWKPWPQGPTSVS